MLSKENGGLDMRKLRILAGLAVAALTLGSCLAGFWGCSKSNAEPDYTPIPGKKAVLMLPGLEGSALYDLATGNEIWSLETDTLNYVLANIPQYTLDLMAVEDDMTPSWKMRVGNMNDAEGIKYSLFTIFKDIYFILEDLQEEFGTSYDLTVWQYDWRQDNDVSAGELEEYIKVNRYEKVAFITHSMGGIVVADYLKKPENRARTELFVPISAPFLGSPSALVNLFGSIEKGVAGTDILPILLGQEAFQISARHMAPVYQLLTFDEFILDPDMPNGWESHLYIGDETATVSELVEFMLAKDYDWIKNSKGEVWPIISRIKEYHDSHFFVSEDGELVHVTALVDTRYIAGKDIATAIAIRIDPESGLIEKKADVGFSLFGDGIVPAFSATAGMDYDAENVYLLDECKGHLDIPCIPSALEAMREIFTELFGKS